MQLFNRFQLKNNTIFNKNIHYKVHPQIFTFICCTNGDLTPRINSA